MEFNIEEERKKYQLTEEVFQDNADEIFGELSFYALEAQNPKFIIIGGQAGSGKTDLVAKKYQELEGNAVIIDQDELRTKYPKEAYQEIIANHTDREEFLILNPYIAKMIREVVTRSRQAGYSVILETALQDVEAFVGYVKEFNDAGYKSELSVLAVPEIEGNISMLYRYCYYLERDGECRRNTRINPNAMNNIRSNIEKLDKLGIFDDIEIYTRNPERNALPIKIFSQKEEKQETPLQAFERGKAISFQTTKQSFQEKYEYIKGVFQQFGDMQRLETLEKLQEQFNDLGERE